MAVLLGGCGSRVADEPSVNSGELAAHAGQVCPQELPIGDDPGGHGFGVEEEADVVPSLLAPEQAWVCRYNPVDAGRTADGGTRTEWPLAVPERDLDESTIPRLQRALDGIRPFKRQIWPGPNGELTGCPANLGPRWMIVYSHGRDLTGVVVDNFGCHEVRLTDEPFTTAPGAVDQEGTVGGVLDGGANLLDLLGLRQEPEPEGQG